MPSIQATIETYLSAWRERDPAARARLVEACWAADGRMVTRGREIRGRVGLLEEMARFVSSPELLDIRLTSVIDAGVASFRFRGVAEFRNGDVFENLDAGEVDANGQIKLILTFSGPLRDASA